MSCSHGTLVHTKNKKKEKEKIGIPKKKKFKIKLTFNLKNAILIEFHSIL